MNKIKTILYTSVFALTVFSASLFVKMIDNVKAVTVYNETGSVTELVDILRLGGGPGGDKVIQVLENNTTTVWGDALSFEANDDTTDAFKITTASSTMSGPKISVNGGGPDMDFQIDALGTGVIDFGSSVQVNHQGLSVIFADDGAVGSNVTISQNSASPAANDVTSNIIFGGNNDVPAPVIYGDIQMQIDDPTAGSESGSMLLKTMIVGSLDTFLGLNGTDGTVDAYKTLVAKDGIEVTGSTLYNTTAVATSTYTLDSGASPDYFLSVTYTGTGAVTIILPTAALEDGREFTIKDTGFNASANNITLTCEGAGTKIENSTSDYVIAGDGDSLTLISDGTDWFIK